MKGLKRLSGPRRSNRGCFLGLLLVGLFLWTAVPCGAERVTVKRVNDGDTVQLADGRLVRYIGIDMTHFGLITIVALSIGLITPPVAVCTILAAKIGGVSIQAVFRASLPMLGAILVALALIMFVPATVVWLPDLVMR